MIVEFIFEGNDNRSSSSNCMYKGWKGIAYEVGSRELGFLQKKR